VLIRTHQLELFFAGKGATEFETLVEIILAIRSSGPHDFICAINVYYLRKVEICFPLTTLASAYDFVPGYDIHSFTVKRAQIAHQIQNSKTADLPRLPILDFEVEPMSVAFRISVYFEQQVVPIYIL
jgi:hypothetical protein